MAIKVPGNPFGVDVQVGSTQEMGLQSAKESEFSARKQFEGLSGTFGKAMEAMQLDIDETVTRDNMMALNSAVDDVLHNKDTGALNRKGKDALVNVNGLSLNDEVQEELKRRYDSIAKGAYNARQKQALSKYYGNVAMNVQQKISAHVIKQQATYRADVRTKETDNALKGVLSNDPETVKSSLLILKRLAEETARENGLEVDYSDFVGKAQAMRITQMLDNDDLDGAKSVLAEAKNDMSAADYQQASRLVSAFSKQKARLGQIANAEKITEDRYSDYGVAKAAIREATGGVLNEAEWELAMKKAGRDPKKAAMIATIGFDHWDSASTEERAKAKHVGDLFRIKSNDFSKQSVEGLVPEVMKLNPKLSYEDARKAAQNIVAKRQSRFAQEQMDRDEATKLAFEMVRKGESMDSIKQTLRVELSADAMKDLEAFQSRMATNSLVTDPGLYWDLTTDPERLKGMSDEAFYRIAKDFTPERYAQLTALRSGLLNGRVALPKESQIDQMVSKAVKEYGINIPKSESGKLVNGYLLDLLSKKLYQKQLLDNRGQPLDEETIRKEIRDFMKTEVTQRDVGMIWWDSNTTGKAFAEGNTAWVDSGVAEMLDTGITAQGNYEPNDVSRTRVLLSVLVTPDARLPGADAMYEWLAMNKASKLRSLEADYKQEFGIAPNAEQVVKTYIEHYFVKQK